MQLRISADARDDVNDIYLRGTLDYGTVRADGYMGELQEAFYMLAEHPMLGREHVEVSPAVRLHRHRAHHILYIAADDEVLILRVLHGRADWVAHL